MTPALTRRSTIVQLQGDQRKTVAAFLLKEKIVQKESLKVHGH